MLDLEAVKAWAKRFEGRPASETLAQQCFWHIEALVAEVERITAKNERLADALEELADWQNGPPLHSYEEGWNAAMAKAYEALGRPKWEHMKP